ncbi:hypothetical protein P1P68_02285 [Streptomyces scabiei]|uniref:hypothetical protein n=1 Tax=Streptomyces scabiei TaxID=1930 RepID=UPI00298F9207|nr:hypothetical protein [Streptomyces scabiei]MDW8803663.1 hypothetical protein [Streptomyces scabiei]
MNSLARRDPETVYTITTRPQETPAVVRYATSPPAPAGAPIPGAELVTLPGGGQTWAYVSPREVPAPVAVTGQPIPAWAKSAALLMWSASGGSVLTGYGLQLAGPWLKDLALLLAAFSVSATVGAWALRGVFARAGRRAGGPTTAEAHATATATGRTLLGGKVTATSTATAIAQSK